MTNTLPLFMVVASVGAAFGQKPNVIFILLDDLGSADVSFYHKMFSPGVPPGIDTPTIDALADTGIKLKQYYSHPTCGPSRNALLTGRYHTNLGNPFMAYNASGSLDTHYNTIADELSIRGYRNYFVGKWGVDDPTEIVVPGSGWGPTERGFHEFYGNIFHALNHYSKLSNFRPLGKIDVNRWTRGGPHLSYPDVDPEPEVHSTTIYTREAISYIRGHVKAHPDKPFFLQLSYTAPHDPLLADADWIAHPSCRGVKNWRRQVYCGMVVGIDDGISNLTSALKDMQVDLDNTIIIFSSDNGGAPGVGGFNTPFRGMKMGAWEGGCRVAGFIRAPKLLGGAGKVWPGLMHIVDWAPTILSLVDGEPGRHALLDQANDQGPIDGMDVAAQLRNSSASPRKDALLVADIFNNRTALVMQGPARMHGKETLWKLVMGHAGESRWLTAPAGHWAYENGDAVDMFSEIWRDMIVKVLGKDFYPFEWSMFFMIGSVKSALIGPREDNLLFNVAIRSLKDAHDRLPLLDHLPIPEWDKFGDGLWLFDLEADPYETNDLSAANPEVIRQMVGRLHGIIENAPDQYGSLMLAARMFMIPNFLLILIVVLVLPSCCCCSMYHCALKAGCRKLKKE